MPSFVRTFVLACDTHAQSNFCMFLPSSQYLLTTDIVPGDSWMSLHCRVPRQAEPFCIKYVGQLSVWDLAAIQQIWCQLLLLLLSADYT